MTKSFSLSVLVPTLVAVSAAVPLAVWSGFDITGRQGVSALPALFPGFLVALFWVRHSKSTSRAAPLPWIVAAGSWHAFMWFTALTQPYAGSFPSALARAFCELLYSASPALLAGLAGVLASLGLMMSVSPVRGPQD